MNLQKFYSPEIGTHNTCDIENKTSVYYNQNVRKMIVTEVLIMRFLKGLCLSLVSLIAGFAAITLPFGLLQNLTGEALHIFFFAEIAVYLVISLIFLLIADRKKEMRKKAEKRHCERCRKIERVHKEWYDIAA